jgi:hypothetical protein
MVRIAKVFNFFNDTVYKLVNKLFSPQSRYKLIFEYKKCKMTRISKNEIEVGKSGRKCQNIEIKR